MTRRLSMSAAVAIKAVANDAESNKHRRFTIVAYTGGPLLVDAFDVPVYVDLAGLYWQAEKRPALYSHDPSKESLVGQLDHIRIEGGQLLVDGFFLKSTAVGREVQAIAEEGYEWQASIGADPEEIEEVPEGNTSEVNGQTVDGPCLISRRTNLGEVSFVVMGADDRTSARITACLKRRRIQAKQGSSAMTFEKWLAGLHFKAEELSEVQMQALRAQFDQLQQNENPGDEEEENVEGEGDEEESVEGEDGEDSKVAADRKKLLLRGARKVTGKQITAAARERAKELKRLGWIHAACKGHPDIEAKALEHGWSLDRTKLEVLRASRATAPLPNKGSAPINAKVMEAALLLTASVAADQVGKWYGEQTVNQAMERDMRGVSLHYVMDSVIEASGGYYRGNRKSNSFIRAALDADRQIRAASGFTTLSMASILENVAHKALISSYESVETVWSEICATRSHNDFKIHSRYRLDSQGSFRKVGPDGELKHIGLSDAKYTNQVDTFGALITLTRQMQFNDDLNAFLELPRIMGRLGALSVEEAVFVLLLSNPGNFFHSNNRNLATGAGSVFGIAGLSLLENKFRDQVDSNGKPILVSPQKLLVPTPLKVEADNVYDEITINETTTTDKGKPARNPHKGKFKPITSPYLSNTALRVLDENDEPAAISGQSSTAYYLFADPNARAALAVAFLNGLQQPTVETAETDFTTLGMQWRSYFDFGVGVEDPTAAAKANGS